MDPYDLELNMAAEENSKPIHQAGPDDDDWFNLDFAEPIDPQNTLICSESMLDFKVEDYQPNHGSMSTFLDDACSKLDTRGQADADSGLSR